MEKNAMGTTSRYSTKYDFRGNVLASREQHGTDYKASSFSYDGRSRLLSETTSVNGGTAATLSYAYLSFATSVAPEANCNQGRRCCC
ncbi:MAG: hypothetical protein IJV37_05870 [Bacteroidales bacterium]|nr:hypothetical protein [Bacteroidales bacterium]